MKTSIFILLGLSGVLLVAVQHQQLNHLRAENTALQQSATEANQMRADLTKYAGLQTQDAADEIARLREENRDLLRLRSEVNQLDDAKAQLERVTAENQRLQLAAASARPAVAKQPVMQPITFRLDALYDRGLSTPEAAIQTFFWAAHVGNADTLSRCVTLPNSPFIEGAQNPHNFEGMVSIEIVARRDINSTTVQLGLEMHSGRDSGDPRKIVLTLVLQDGEWRVDTRNL